MLFMCESVSLFLIMTIKIYLESCSLSSGKVCSSGSVGKSLLSLYCLLARITEKDPCGCTGPLNCVLGRCSGWEAVNQLKMPDQFDLSSPLSSFCLHSKLFTEFILKVPLGRLVKQKLECLIDIVHSDLFTHHGEHTHIKIHALRFLSACTFTHVAVM